MLNVLNRIKRGKRKHDNDTLKRTTGCRENFGYIFYQFGQILLYVNIHIRVIVIDKEIVDDDRTTSS